VYGYGIGLGRRRGIGFGFRGGYGYGPYGRPGRGRFSRGWYPVPARFTALAPTWPPRYAAQAPAAGELDQLISQAEIIKAELSRIEARISDLKDSPD